MASTVVGLFDDAAQAHRAAQDLIDAGIPRDAISVAANNVRREHAAGTTEETPAVGDNFVAGLGTGAVLGGLGGLLVGLAALAIPGIGPIVAAGPLFSALTGVGVGAAIGGIIGGLTEAGVPEEHAGYYAEGIRRGGTLVLVQSDDDARASRAAEILEKDGAVDIEERAAQWRQQGWTAYNPKAEPYTAEQIDEERRRYHAAPATATAAAATAAAATTAPAAAKDTAAREVTVPVIEEDLQVGKRAVRGGGVRIYKQVTEKPVEEQVQLREEHVTVDRRPADRPATEADLKMNGKDVVEVTETIERPVVSKEARVVEEVVVGKDIDQRTETVRDTVRRTDVRVEQLGATDKTADGRTY